MQNGKYDLGAYHQVWVENFWKFILEGVSLMDSQTNWEMTELNI